MAKTLPVPIICGPTGAGKTGLAVELAAEFSIEVVSADSRQIIRHLDIGTAKPTPAERQAVRFHLIDLIEPGERYTAFRFIDDANQAIADILSRGAIPLIVGGTGLYLRALTEGIVEIEEEDLSIRDRIERDMDQLGPDAMYERLTQIDPIEASRLHPNDRIRVTRALEIFARTGHTRSELAATGRYRKAEYEFEYFCLAPLRETLYARINRRVDQMMTEGLADEVKQVSAEIGEEPLRRANVIGYKEILEYQAGQSTLEEAIALIKQNHRRYAKRQMTWFRHQINCLFFADRTSLIIALRSRLTHW